MKRSLLQHLVCPVDGKPLTLVDAAEERNEIKSGALVSSEGRRYEIRRFIPRFVPSEQYSDTFSEQRRMTRRHFEKYRSSASGDLAVAGAETVKLFCSTTGFKAPLGGVTLDAGCGYGRFLRSAASLGTEVIGVDLSTDTVELAYDAAGTEPKVHIVQADLGNLPFRPNYFPQVFSIGVLHHTPDPPHFFGRLARHVAPGGEFAVWVYAPEFKRTPDRWRVITTRLPLRLVWAWCIVNEAVFGWMRSLPVGGGRIGVIIPGGTIDTPFWARVIEDFDDLTPRYAFTYTHEQVKSWFAKAGFVEIEALPRATAVRGLRPASAAQSVSADAGNALGVVRGAPW